MTSRRNGSSTASGQLSLCAGRALSLKGAEFDTLLAAYIINPGNSYDDVASVAKDYGLHIVSSDESVYGKGAKRAVPVEDVLSEHLGRKALAIQSLREKFSFRSLENNDQLELFEEPGNASCAYSWRNGINWRQGRC